MCRSGVGLPGYYILVFDLVVCFSYVLVLGLVGPFSCVIIIVLDLIVPTSSVGFIR